MTSDRLEAAQRRAVSAWLGTEMVQNSEDLLIESDPTALERWPVLKEGDRVMIQHDGRTVYGTVDCVTVDGSIFWTWLDNGAGRTAFHEDQNAMVTLQNPASP
ncbi:hypothetical protein ACIPYV_16595 [Paenarthrobacter nicotinovorans]|uniref:hypothetical protein n=1 Tax=Paenarthrobacter nicotinovorans TaxID=29320 RepID=UPI0038118E34